MQINIDQARQPFAAGRCLWKPLTGLHINPSSPSSLSLSPYLPPSYFHSLLRGYKASLVESPKSGTPIWGWNKPLPRELGWAWYPTIGSEFEKASSFKEISPGPTARVPTNIKPYNHHPHSVGLLGSHSGCSGVRLESASYHWLGLVVSGFPYHDFDLLCSYDLFSLSSDEL